MSSPFKVRSQSWPRVSALLDEALELDASQRAGFVARVAGDDAELGAELWRLLPGVVAAAGDITVAAPYATLLGEALLAAAATEADAAAVDATGSRFGAWTLVARLGSGGMGEVWRAQRSDGLFTGSAAIKLLRSDLPADRLAARFARERAVLARLNHPHIARLLDAGIANGQAFIVLELVEGEPLLAYAASHAPTLAARVRLVRDIARAVEHAHSQLVLHRDLKPSNVLVTRDGTAKLLDFGIAAALDEANSDETASNLTQISGRGLTLEYAAPEQIVGEPTVAASDVYSLGAMLFHLVTGGRPFAASSNRKALEYAIIHHEAPRASASVQPLGLSREVPRDAIAPPVDSRALRGDLDAVIAKALRKSATARYSTATAFAADLDAWLQRRPIAIRAYDQSYRARLWLRRNWAAAALGGVAVAAVLAGLGVSFWQRGEAVAAAARATAAAALASDEAARANKVADYLGELIQSASPDQHKGEWPTVLALLEESEKALDERFKDDPRTRLLLLERMADTNNALNRNTVSLAQYEQLLAALAANGEISTTRAVEVRKNYASMLVRLGRYADAGREYERLDPLIRALYGERSEAYGALLQNKGVQLAAGGQLDEARTLLARGGALLTSLFPDNVAKRMDLANDAAVMYSRMDMWREAEAALAGNEKDLALLATQGGSSARDAIIQRNNLEAIRIRLGKYRGVDERLRVNAEAARKLLGGVNPLSNRSDELRSTALSSTGRFDESVRMVRERAEANKRQRGADPAPRIEDQLIVLRDAAIYTRIPLAGVPSGLAQTAGDLRRLIASIATELPASGDLPANLYRIAADAAVAMQQYDIARDALARSRETAARTGVTSPEQLAQIDRAAGALAYYTGDARRGASLLEPRFAAYRLRREDSTPRLGGLWIQRGLYQCGFDATAAAESARQGRAVFARAGETPPHFAALLALIDVCGSTGPARRAAEDAVDAAFFRLRPSPWRPPFMASL